MCIIVVNKKDRLERNTLKACWDNNPDGAGLCWNNEDGSIDVFKELFKFKVFYKKYLSVREEIDTPIILHFRIATSGKVNKQNCHPFEVNPGLWFAHNGMISGYGGNKISDTVEFNKIVLQELPDGFIDHPVIRGLVEHYISGSKIAFLDSKKNVTILNEKDGHWDDDNWYSNFSYYSYSTGASYWKGQGDTNLNQDSVYCLSCNGYLMNYAEIRAGVCKYCEQNYGGDKEDTEVSDKEVSDIKECTKCKGSRTYQVGNNWFCIPCGKYFEDTVCSYCRSGNIQDIDGDAYCNKCGFNESLQTKGNHD